MCGTNKAINAFQQGKHTKQEILHSVTYVLSVIPYRFAQHLSELKGRKMLYRHLFRYGASALKMFCFSMFTLFSQSDIGINHPAQTSDLVAQMCSSPKVRQSRESFMIHGAFFWWLDSPFLQGFPVPQTMHRWITTFRPFYKVYLCALKIYLSHDTNICASSNTCHY